MKKFLGSIGLFTVIIHYPSGNFPDHDDSSAFSQTPDVLLKGKMSVTLTECPAQELSVLGSRDPSCSAKR